MYLPEKLSSYEGFVDWPPEWQELYKTNYEYMTGLPYAPTRPEDELCCVMYEDRLLDSP